MCVEIKRVTVYKINKSVSAPLSRSTPCIGRIRTLLPHPLPPSLPSPFIFPSSPLESLHGPPRGKLRVWSTTLRSDGEPQAGGGIPWILCRHQCRVSSSQNTRATISKSTVTNKEYPGKILTVWRIWKRTQGGCAQLRWIKLFKSSLVVLKLTGSRLGL